MSDRNLLRTNCLLILFSLISGPGIFAQHYPVHTYTEANDLRSGEHLLSLINKVLNIAKIESVRVALDPVNFDVHILAEDIRKMFWEKTQYKGLYFEIQGIDSVSGYIIADETKLRVVLINLKPGTNLNNFDTLDLHSLDAAFLAELSTAVKNTDAVKIAELSKLLTIQEPTIASALLACANNFDYGSIHSALLRTSTSN